MTRNIAVTNSGLDDLTGATISDTLPTSLLGVHSPVAKCFVIHLYLLGTDNTAAYLIHFSLHPLGVIELGIWLAVCVSYH